MLSNVMPTAFDLSPENVHGRVAGLLTLVGGLGGGLATLAAGAARAILDIRGLMAVAGLAACFAAVVLAATMRSCFSVEAPALREARI